MFSLGSMWFEIETSADMFSGLLIAAICLVTITTMLTTHWITQLRHKGEEIADLGGTILLAIFALVNISLGAFVSFIILGIWVATIICLDTLKSYSEFETIVKKESKC